MDRSKPEEMEAGVGNIESLDLAVKTNSPEYYGSIDGHILSEEPRIRMSILHVCESLPGGTSSYLDEILPYQVFRFGRENVALLAPMAQFEYLRRVERASFVGYRRTGRNLASIRSLAVAIRRQIEARRPDILHLHSSVAGAVGRVVAAATQFDGRLVYCAHGWAIDPGRRSSGQALFRLAEQMLYPASDAIVNISPHEDAFLPAAWRRGRRLHLIQSGIAAAPRAPERVQVADGDGERSPWRLLFVGRTDRQKGFDLLVDEMAFLQGLAELTVAGGAVVDAQHGPVPLPNVKMLGWLPRDQIAHEMEEADFVVMPSRWEGMPLVALEAMRAGRAVIASDHGPFPHIIDHKRNGLIVDIAEPGFLARALAGLSKRDACAMGSAARETFEQRFTSTEMNRRLIALYEELRSAPVRRVRAPRVIPSPRPAGVA